MRVFLSNLGCKLNQAEIDAMARRFQSCGDEIVGSLAEADLHVVNSCTVTHAAARDSRKLARRGGRQAPGIRTVVTGCWATVSRVEAESLDNVHLVVPNDRKDDLVALTHARFAARIVEESRDPAAVRPPDSAVPVSYVPLRFGPTRGLVKIEDGCNMACSFCIIPSTRGRQRSRSVNAVVADVQGLVAGGYTEVVVTGVQISAYRDGKAGLYELVVALLGETDIGRLRLTSIAPWQLDGRLLDLLKDPRLCRHLHFSLQSGCRETLSRMRRPYSPENYRDLVQRARAHVQGLAITTDVIVGFPGETSGEFEESLEFVDEMGFARTHVFNYSARSGTQAAGLPDQVSVETRKERMQQMLQIAERSERQFRVDHLETDASVLWEQRSGDGWQGMTDNYIRVETDSDADLRGRLSAVRLVGLTERGMSAELENPNAPATARCRRVLEQ